MSRTARSGRRGQRLVSVVLSLVAACAVGLVATGLSSGGTAAPKKLTLMLDFIPSPYHIGIYQAVKAGYYKKNNIDLRIIQPTSAGDYARLVSAGKADIGMADAVDLLTFIDKGTKYEGFMS